MSNYKTARRGKKEGYARMNSQAQARGRKSFPSDYSDPDTWESGTELAERKPNKPAKRTRREFSKGEPRAEGQKAPERRQSNRASGEGQGEREFNRADRPRGQRNGRRHGGGGGGYGRGPGRPQGRNNKRKPVVKGLDPNRLIKKAKPVEEVVYTPEFSYEEMVLNGKLKANLSAAGFKHPTQIQAETLEVLIEGRNLVGVANTGTGKTGAFLIPIIEQLLTAEKPFTAMVVVPTRELAQQVEQEFAKFTKGTGLRFASFIGGTSVGADISKIRRRNHLIIGTPGRLIDLANRKALNFKWIRTLVLDEFDRMLDMGFVNDIQKMVAGMEFREQTMLFSATIDRTQEKIINELVEDPVEVKVSSGNQSSDAVDQDIIRVPEGEDKFELLLKVMEEEEFEKMLIFTETKRLVDRVSRKLNNAGMRAEQIHGDKSQNYRTKALDKFKRGKVNVLVATDVAARGIDVSGITHVINYQMPKTYDSYVHRIGRTGRAGKTGKALTFVD